MCSGPGAGGSHRVKKVHQGQGHGMSTESKEEELAAGQGWAAQALEGQQSLSRGHREGTEVVLTCSEGASSSKPH